MAEKKFSRDQLNSAMREARKRFSHRKNVTGFDVGYKWTGETPTKQLCVRIHVEEKIPLSELESAEIFPEDIDGVPLDVIRGPYRVNLERHALNPRDYFPVLMGGISCGRTDDSTGTLGAVVIDNASNRTAVLSNWHVMAGANGRNGDRIVQPGLIEASTSAAGEIARLARSILDIDGDAAIATLSGHRPWVPVQHQSFIAPSGIRDSRLGEVLQKSGRTTGVTRGRVDGEGLYRLRYEVRPGVEEIREIAGFKLVPETPGNPNNDELSGPGDSGSLWVHPGSGEAVGLHFAGERNPNPMAEHAIACNMTRVADRLDIRMASFDDLLADAKALTDGSRKELSLPPDWPDPWPYPWPPQPFPPGGGWPPPPPWPPIGPYPPVWPAVRGYMDILPHERGLRGDHRHAFQHDRDVDTAPTPERLRGSVAETFDEIWRRMRQALGKDPGLSTRVTDYFQVARPLAELANVVNKSAAFNGIGLRRVSRQDFGMPYDFEAVCYRLIEIIQNEKVD